ncbi:hypothetical protein SMICM304S_08411 [Streptomyces microflavus]
MHPAEVMVRPAENRSSLTSESPSAKKPEKAEGELLDSYLPKQLTDDELNTIVASAVEEAKAAGAEGPRAMGAVMKIVNPKVAGLAEGGRVAAAVKKLLAG